MTLRNRFGDLFEQWKSGLGEDCSFIRDRIYFTPITTLLSLVRLSLDGFDVGDDRLAAKMWEEKLCGENDGKPPSGRALREAAGKLPSNEVLRAVEVSNSTARQEFGQDYRGMWVTLCDGTKIIIPRNDETVEAYGLGSGRTGDAYYPQIHAVGFYDLASRTFSHADLTRGVPDERGAVLDHARRPHDHVNLYVSDAGLNGMAFMFILSGTGHHIMMRQKMGPLAEMMKDTRKRSMVVEVVLTAAMMANYPEMKSMVGKTMRIRLVRTRGTTRLPSMVLATTLLDEKEYPWEELSLLYLQRKQIEFGFRHLKVVLDIEHVRKERLEKILQCLYAAILLYNLGSILRNRIEPPSLFPNLNGDRKICLEHAIQSVMVFIVAATRKGVYGEGRLRRAMVALSNATFTHHPWRVKPRICQFPASVFTRQKSTKQKEEICKCLYIKNDLVDIGRQYGHFPKRKAA